MPESEFERVIFIAQQNWNNFISLIKQDLNSLYADQRQVTVEIKKIERVTKILQRGQDNVDFLLLHKDSIIGLDGSLIQKFAILDAFKKRDNLGNAVAIRTFNEILDSESLKRTSEQLNNLREKRDSLDEEVDKVVDLIQGVAFDIGTIIKYSQKHNLSVEEQNALVLYVINKSSKKMVPNTHKKPEIPRQNVPTNTEENEVEDILDKVEAIEETPDYKEEFEVHKKRYDEIKTKGSALLNKYYLILQSMTATESQYYRIYCSMTANELKEQQFEGKYEEAMAKIIAIKLFDAKGEIEKIIQTIHGTNYSNKDDVEFFEEYVTEYQSLLDKLEEIDNKIVGPVKDPKRDENLKVFFLTDDTMQPFIPEVIRNKGYQGSLVNFFQKAQEGHIQKKKGGKIVHLKGVEEREKEIDKTIFMITNKKIIVSYVKLNSSTGLNDGGIVILTSSLLNPNTILEDTDKIIRENREQIVRQLDAIERGDPQQIELQKMIVETLILQAQNSEETMEDGELNGRKIK